jgi:hypothetical protein
MGDRASVILTKDGEESPVLCQHWGGSEFHEEVREFVTKCYEVLKDPKKFSVWQGVAMVNEPNDRLEPSRLFVKIVREFGEGGYIAKTRDEVDDSDNGCLYVELGEDKPTFTL